MGNKQEHGSERHHHHHLHHHHIGSKHEPNDVQHPHNGLMDHHIGSKHEPNDVQLPHNGLIHHHIELDRSDGIYLPNEIVSGSVMHMKKRRAYVTLTGIVYFEKHRRTGVENCRITFYSAQFDLIPSLAKQSFEFQLSEYLPPTFNDLSIIPNITYTVNLIYRKSKDEIFFSIPIRVCPLIQIDQPVLFSPLTFGPIDNPNYGTKLEVKLDRTAFTFNDNIEVYYELQNPMQEDIYKININLAAYYLVESNIREQDIINNRNDTPSKDQLIKNKISLKIPSKIYLPPTFKYTYEQGNDEAVFHLTIDYKIQIQIYLSHRNNLWQVDVPIILCNELIGQTENSIID